jgi:transcription elongation GreA/GreB family factor
MEIEISSVGGVSPDSPLGSALMGTKVGEGVDVPAPRGAWRATVVSIRAS